MAHQESDVPIVDWDALQEELSRNIDVELINWGSDRACVAQALEPAHRALLSQFFENANCDTFFNICCRLNELLDRQIVLIDQEQRHLVGILQLAYILNESPTYQTLSFARLVSSDDPNRPPIPSDLLLLQWLKYLVDKALAKTVNLRELIQDLMTLRTRIEASENDVDRQAVRNAKNMDEYIVDLARRYTLPDAVPQTPGQTTVSKSGTPNAEPTAAPSPVMQSNDDAEVKCRPVTHSTSKRASILANRPNGRKPTRTQSMPLLPSSSISFSSDDCVCGVSVARATRETSVLLPKTRDHVRNALDSLTEVEEDEEGEDG